MLFFWVYLEWVVVLTGAEFVYCLGAFVPGKAPLETFDPVHGLPEILAVLREIWSEQKRGAFMNMKKLFAAETIEDRTKLRGIVDFLLQNDVIHRTAGGELAVSGDLHSMTLYDLYAKIPPEIIRGENGGSAAIKNMDLDAVRERVQVSLKAQMDVPLITFVQDSKTGVQ
jgi:membrane protein